MKKLSFVFTLAFVGIHSFSDAELAAIRVKKTVVCI